MCMEAVYMLVCCSRVSSWSRSFWYVYVFDLVKVCTVHKLIFRDVLAPLREDYALLIFIIYYVCKFWIDFDYQTWSRERKEARLRVVETDNRFAEKHALRSTGVLIAQQVMWAQRKAL